MLIQFGHNDKSTKPERHVSPKDYQKNLIRFCDEVRAKKGHPIILTSIVMREFVNEESRQDDTHLREKGAVAYAGFIAEGIKEQKIKPLLRYLK